MSTLSSKGTWRLLRLMAGIASIWPWRTVIGLWMVVLVMMMMVVIISLAIVMAFVDEHRRHRLVNIIAIDGNTIQNPND